MADQPDYKSYLLRLWQAQTAGGMVWRASLEEPHTGTRLGFSSLQRLHEFLLDQTTAEPDRTTPPATTRGATRLKPDDRV